MNEETLFHHALQKVPAERDAYLEEACGGDAGLQRRVRALVHAADNPGDFMGRPAADLAATTGPQAHGARHAASGPTVIPEGPGTPVGPYKLLQQIGEGGMGVVFMAEQAHPVRRKVAVKIIKPGMDSRQVVARFEAERQALAMMDHPNITRVLEAGTTASGRPYFVMELVSGVPITRYCDELCLPIRRRLELFIPVCHAIQHAHQKGVIHRDLKPGNVLVALYDDEPVPKVIDFGVAKAAGQQLTEATLFTGFGSVVGTVEYMSPEQAGLNQLDVDTRSDVYALGVLLYELLTGTTPLEPKRVKTAALLEVLRLVREEEAPKPSTRLDAAERLPSVAACRGLEPAKLGGVVRGELDWIVMKALEKDRARRYETANGLAQDIERYLADEPVQACPASAAYRARKFGRRHRGPVVAAVLVLVALLAGFGAAARQAVRANRQAARADLERAQAVAERNEKRAALDAETAAREQVMAALRSLTDDVVVWRLSEGPGLTGLDQVYLKRIIAHYQAFADLKGETSESRFIRAQGHLRLGLLRHRLGEHGEADASYERAVVLFKQLEEGSPAVPDFRRYLALVRVARGHLLSDLHKPTEAESEFRQAADIRAQVPDAARGTPDYRRYLVTDLDTLHHLLTRLRRRAAAEAEVRRAVPLREQLASEFPGVPEYAVDLARNYCHLGGMIWHGGEMATVVEWYGKAIDTLVPVNTRDPLPAAARLYLCDSHMYRAKALSVLGRFGEAAADYERAAELEEGSRRSEFRFHRAACLAHVRPAEAVGAADELMAGRPDDLENTARCAPLVLLAGDAAAYQRLCKRQLERAEKLRCNDLPGRRPFLLARLCLLNPDSDPAEPFRLATQALRHHPGAAHYLHTLGLAHYRSGRYPEAVKRLEEAYQAEPSWGAQPVNRLVLAMAYHQLHRADDARRTLLQATGAVDHYRTHAATDLAMHAHDWIAWQLLHREAEQLIDGSRE